MKKLKEKKTYLIALLGALGVLDVVLGGVRIDHVGELLLLVLGHLVHCFFRKSLKLKVNLVSNLMNF